MTYERKRGAVAFPLTQASVALDGLRGIAALLVSLEHLRFRLRFGFPPSLPLHGLFILATFGHQAVILFFVLSGFLVGGSLLRAHRNRTWSWRPYLIRRFVRLWIVLIPALLIGGIWDSLTVYFVRHHHVVAPVVARAAETKAFLTPRIFFENVAFLQNIVSPIFGSNGPLWSLSNEFWYYILFPFLVFALLPQYSKSLRIIFAVVALLIVLGIGTASFFAPLWLFGALLFFTPRAPFGRRMRAIAFLSFIFFIFCAREISYRFPLISDYFLALTTCVFIWIICSAREAADQQSSTTRTFRLLARFSYTLYLIHVPIFTLVGTILVKDEVLAPTLPHLAYAFVLWCMTILFAYAVASLTEFRTDSVRIWVESKLFRVSAKEASQLNTTKSSTRPTPTGGLPLL